jgi:hypothetical protein
MMRLERLSPSFLTSSIKLIPKKGDVTLIKNWRPISLLNVGYKIISKAINNRLKKVSNTILSRAQKGFTNNKVIQECLINICETVSFCKKNKIKSFLLAIDQAKAFDTVSHKFIHEVYRFFGFGDRFIKMLELTTMGRNATIMLDGGKLTKSFKLGTGFTQGNAPSPLQFNFCEQIFIFKIELDERIKSIDWHLSNNTVNAIPRALPGDVPVRGQGGQGEDRLGIQPQEAARAPPIGKVEGFADDATVLGKAEKIALDAIKEIMLNFAIISGLKANFDKCVLIPLGFENDIPDYFFTTGFTVDNKAKILGCTVYDNPEDLTKNFDDVISSIIKIRNFWSRFNLSLPGRIAIAKSLMLSKLSYLGSIFEPTPTQFSDLESVIYNFIKGKLNLSWQRIPSAADLGGIGMIEIREFLSGLKVSWIKRAGTTCDLWAHVLNSCGFGDPDSFDTVPVGQDLPILSNISKSFINFRHKFLLNGNNLMASRIYNNPHLTPRFDTTGFAENAPDNYKAGLKRLSFDKCIVEKRVMSYDEINSNENLLPDRVTFGQIQLLCREALKLLKQFEKRYGTAGGFPPADADPGRYGPGRAPAPVPVPAPIPDPVPDEHRKFTLSWLLKRKVKGSKLFRSYLTKARCGNKMINSKIAIKFCSLIESPRDLIRFWSRINQYWTKNF